MTTLIDQELDDADGSKKFSREPGRVSSPVSFAEYVLIVKIAD